MKVHIQTCNLSTFEFIFRFFCDKKLTLTTTCQVEMNSILGNVFHFSKAWKQSIFLIINIVDIFLIISHRKSTLNLYW